MLAEIKPPFIPLKKEEARESLRRMVQALSGLSKISFEPASIDIVASRGEVRMFLHARSEQDLDLLCSAFKQALPSLELEKVGYGGIRFPEGISVLSARFVAKSQLDPLPFVDDGGDESWIERALEILSGMDRAGVQVTLKPIGMWPGEAELYARSLREKVYRLRRERDSFMNERARMVLRKGRVGGFFASIKLWAKEESDLRKIATLLNLSSEWAHLAPAGAKPEAVLNHSLINAFRASAPEVATFFRPPLFGEVKVRKSYRIRSEPPVDLIRRSFRDGVLLCTTGGVEVRISEDAFRRGFLILGEPGSGKTTTHTHLAMEAFDKFGATVFMILPKPTDAEKVLGEFRARFGDERLLRDLIYIDFRNSFLSLNWFELPKDEPRESGINRVISRLINFIEVAKEEKLGQKAPTTERLIDTIIRYLFSVKERPTPMDFVRVVNHLATSRRVPEDLIDPSLRSSLEDFLRSSKPIDTLNAIWNRFKDFIFNPVVANLVNAERENLDIEKLIGGGGKFVLIDLGNLDDVSHMVVSLAITIRIWDAVRVRRSGKLVLLVYDEVGTSASHIETLKEISAKGRALGLGQIYATQYPEQVPRDIMLALVRNMGNLVVHSVKNLPLAETLRIPGYEDLAKYVTFLPRGEALFLLKTDLDEVIPPFIGRVPSPIGRSLSEDEKVALAMVNAKAKGLEASRVIVEEESRPSVLSYVIKLIKDGATTEREILLRLISNGLEVDDYAVADALQKLINQGLLKAKVTPKGIIYLPTTRFVEVYGESSGATKRGGGELHRVLTEVAKEYLEWKGYSVTIIAQGGSKQPDLIASKGDEVIYVEVETTANKRDQIVRNVSKASGRRVLFVTPSPEVKAKILEAVPLPNVEVRTLDEILDEMKVSVVGRV